MEIKKLSKEKFPQALLEIPQPPKELWICGDWPEEVEDQVYLCVVGSRRFTYYGRDICEKIIDGLKGYPVVIVSGFAMGIDTIAHKRAMKNNLHTIVFPGSGLSKEAIYKAKAVKELYKSKMSISDIRKTLQIGSNSTVYSYLNF